MVIKQYKVFLAGRNYLMRFDDEVEKVGFFTTRWIDSSSLEDAKRQAIELIKSELQDLVLNKHSDPPKIIVESVSVVDPSERNLSQGRGFTWYGEDEEDERGNA